MITRPAKCGTENLLVTKITAQPFTTMDNPLTATQLAQRRKERNSLLKTILVSHFLETLLQCAERAQMRLTGGQLCKLSVLSVNPAQI